MKACCDTCEYFDYDNDKEKGFEKLINIVDKLSQMIDTSTQNMENIKHILTKTLDIIYKYKIMENFYEFRRLQG